MVKLSERLQKIAACINPGETVADIGTDHGLLPIFLYEQAISPKIILCDIRSGPLAKAKKNIALLAPDFIPDIRQGDGLSLLATGEVDTVVIAGMGGELIADILLADPEKTKSVKKLILQPRTASDRLREALFRSGIAIIDEHLAMERGRICEILVAVPDSILHFNEKGKEAIIAAMQRDLGFEVSSLLLLKKDPYLPAFVEQKITREKEIIKNINENGRNVSYLKAEYAKKRREALEIILHRIKSDDRKE